MCMVRIRRRGLDVNANLKKWGAKVSDAKIHQQERIEENKKKFKRYHKEAYQELEQITNEFMEYAEDMGAFNRGLPGLDFLEQNKVALSKLASRNSQHARGMS